MNGKKPDNGMVSMKKIVVGLLTGMLLILLTACGDEQEIEAGSKPVYYVNNAETKLEAHYHKSDAATVEEQVAELLECLATTPEKLEYKAPLNMGFQVRSTRLTEGTLRLDMDAAYKKLSATTEVLVRAAIVRTLTQLQGVSYVLITVEGEQLYDGNGSPVGRMNASQFIVNDGNAINTHELARIRLYFAGENGESLIAAYRERHYSTNTSLERLVVEELIAGPTGQIEGLYPSINPNTKIINVTTKDGICYVNLDESFLTVVNNVSTEVSVYSIVNSLVELSSVTKVQILVNGEVPAAFSNKIYDRNLDIVTVLEK